MIRLKDIAVHAGVSIMTVSKVMRDAPDISLATKERVRQLANKMGYVPDTLAQSLRTRKTRLIGLVISSLANPVMVRVTMAIEEFAFKAGYELILAHSMNAIDRETNVLRRLMARRVDGLVLTPVYRPENQANIYDELQNHNIPTVIVGPVAPFCAGFDNVESDDAEASFKMTQHLIELGHRRIAFLAGSAFIPWAQARKEGYRRALREAQIEWDDRLVFNAGSTIEEGAQAARQILAEKPEVTAIQAVNDMVAVGAGRVLLDNGIRIPQDVSLAGFGGYLVSEFFRVPLTTVHQPKYRLGTAAGECLQKLLKGDISDSVTLLSCELVIRASTAPPSNAKKTD